MSNPKFGAGTQPAGTTPAGGYYGSGPNAGVVVYPDPHTGVGDSGRLIDLRSRSFVYTTDGRAEGMSTVPQIVLIAWGTLDLSSVPDQSTGYERRLQALYENAVRFLIDQKMLSIVEFTITKFGQTSIRVLIRWRDLTNGVEHIFTPST